VNKPIVNFAQMKTIIAPRLVPDRKLFNPHSLIKEVDYLADNATNGGKYANMTTGESRTWLRIWLRWRFD
jgi:hypothetical protein